MDFGGFPKVLEVVLMVGLSLQVDFWMGKRDVVGIRRGVILLEEIVMGKIIVERQSIASNIRLQYIF